MKKGYRWGPSAASLRCAERQGEGRPHNGHELANKSPRSDTRNGLWIAMHHVLRVRRWRRVRPQPTATTSAKPAPGASVNICGAFAAIQGATAGSSTIISPAIYI